MKNYKVLADCRDMSEDEIVDTILENRGIKDVEHFLNPVADDMLPLSSLKRIDEAFNIVLSGIKDNKSFGVLADTDTDGVCAGTIMTRYLKEYTDNVQTYVNCGKTHGLIGQNIDRFSDVDIVIVVDSLDENTSQYEKLWFQGKQIIIFDHHNIDCKIPYDDYTVLVSSQREYENTHLSGAGVVWKFCKYVDEKLHKNYADFLVDLAACGILADVSDVSEGSKENRYIVNEGLNNLLNQAIRNIVGSYEFNSKSVLFSVAPLINASCRTAQNEIALKMFLSDDHKEINTLKKTLEKCKEKQTEQLEQILPNVYKDFDKQVDSKVLYTIIDTEYGVSGLIGNKCVDVYNKPMFILKDCGDKYYGSMRSIGYGDFRTLCNDTGLAILNGHEEASGVVVEKNKLEKFIAEVNNRLSRINQTTTADIEVDCELNLADITRKLVQKVKQINKISGEGFKPITVKVSNICDYSISNFKAGKHLVIYPTECEYFQIIEWNTKVNYGVLEDASLFNTPIEVVGELDSGWFAKRFMLKIIISDLVVG